MWDSPYRVIAFLCLFLDAGLVTSIINFSNNLLTNSFRWRFTQRRGAYLPSDSLSYHFVVGVTVMVSVDLCWPQGSAYMATDVFINSAAFDGPFHACFHCLNRVELSTCVKANVHIMK